MRRPGFYLDMDQRRFSLPTPSSIARLAAPLFLILAGGCQSMRPSPTVAPTFSDPNRTRVTLTLWHAQAGPARDQLESLTTDFTKSYPWIQVRVEAKGDEGDLLRQGIAAIALDQLPDLVIADVRTISDLARRDALIPLDSFTDDASLGITTEDREDFVPGMLQAGQFSEFGNHLYALPFDERAVVLFYNADALSSAGIAPPRNWDDFGEAARRTTTATMQGWAMAPDAAVFYAILFSRQSDVLNASQAQVLFNGTAGMQALQLISGLSKGGSAYLVPDDISGRNDFARGKAALFLGTTDDVEAIARTQSETGNKFNWGIANLPQVDPSHPSTALVGSRIAIFHTSAERERAAWLFGRWLTMPEQAARWSQASRTLPTRLSALGLLMQNANELPFTVRCDRVSVACIPDPLPLVRGIPTIKQASLLDQAIGEMWVSVAGGMDPAVAMDRAVQRANRALGQAP